MTTSLPSGAVLTSVQFPKWLGKVGGGFCEVNTRRSDFALVAAAAQVELTDDRRFNRIAIGIGPATDFPIRLASAEEQLKGGTPDALAVKGAVLEALTDVAPLSDLHASAEYRRRVAVSLATRAVADARAHAIGEKHHAN